MRLALPPDSCKVYTPSPLADAMVASLGDEPHFAWLEPSHGRGAFVEAMALRGIGSGRIHAIDLDRTPAPADVLAATLRGVDFLRWATLTKRRFDRIVGNPPYIAISQLPVSLRIAAARVTDLAGRPIGEGSNVWYSFVLASIKLLNRGGSLAFVLPSSAEFADYSAAFRDAIRTQFKTLELYRSHQPLFPDVQEGSLVAIARNHLSPPFRIVRRRFATPAKLIGALRRIRRTNGRPCPNRPKHATDGMVRFGSVADVRLGGVTGDVQYFLMNEETRCRLDLPPGACTPVVSRARHLRSSCIDLCEWEALKESGERVWLFNPPEAVSRHPAVMKYLRRRVGGCNRRAFKVANREPWYRTPLPPKPDAFLSGMSQVGPWLCMNGMPGLSATNTLYVISFKIEKQNERYGYALALLTRNVRGQLRRPLTDREKSWTLE